MSGDENVNINAQVAEAAEIPPPYQGQDWEDLLQGAHVVQGSEQEKGNALISVPFVLVQITIQPGDFRHGRFSKEGALIPDTGCGAEHPYAYLNAIIGPPKAWDKARLKGKVSQEVAEMFDPGDSIGFIEAGTGVYREVLHYLEANGRLILPADGPEGGAFGESRYDQKPWKDGEDWSTWTCDAERFRITYSDGTGGKRAGQAIFRYSWNIRLVCPRGLRVSEYKNEYTKEGRTRYFG